RDLLLVDHRAVVVREAVDVLDLDPVEQHPVEPREVLGATLERLRVHLGPIPGGRTREVHGVELPGPGAGRFEAQVRRWSRRHGSSSVVAGSGGWCGGAIVSGTVDR